MPKAQHDVAKPLTPSYGEGRDALLRATVAVVARGGLRALTYRAVAQEAGVAHALVRFHFGSRDALIVAATEYSLPEAIRVGGLESTSTNVDDYAAGLEQVITSEGDLMAFQYEVILESRRRPELRPAVRDLYATFWKTASEDLRHRGVNADDSLGVLVFAALDGLVFQAVSMDDPDAAVAALAQLRTLLALARKYPEELAPAAPPRRRAAGTSRKK